MGNEPIHPLDNDSNSIQFEKEQLEIEKLRAELRQLNRSSWKNPTYLTVFISAASLVLGGIFSVNKLISTIDADHERKKNEILFEQEKLKDAQELAKQERLSGMVELLQFKADSARDELERIQMVVNGVNMELNRTQIDLTKKLNELNTAERKLQNLKMAFLEVFNFYINDSAANRTMNLMVNHDPANRLIMESFTLYSMGEEEKAISIIKKFAFGVSNRVLEAELDRREVELERRLSVFME